MTDLRQIGDLHIPNLRPADIAAAPLPMLEWLDVDDLWVDPAYQRDLTPKALRLVAELVEGWDWLKCAPLLVALTENGLEVYDGQCRATAGRLHPQITTLPAYVVDGSTLPQRAGAFVAHARARVAVTPGQVHHAAVTAGDAEAVELDAACRAAGLHLLPFSPDRSTYKPRQTIALASVRQILKRRGAEVGTAVLRAAADTEFAPVSAEHLKVADALLCGEDYAGEFDGEAVTALLKGIGPRTYVEARELSIAKHLPTWRALTAVLYRGRDKRRGRPVDQSHGGALAPRTENVGAGPVTTKNCGSERKSSAPADPDSTLNRAPGKGTYQAPTPSAARPVRDRDSTPPLAPRRAVSVTSDICGDPPPGRSALDQRKAAS